MASTAAKYVVLLSNNGIAYLLRDEFTTDAAAPMGTDPITRTCEPGPGTLRLRQQNGTAEWRIVGGVLETSAASTTTALVVATPNGTTGYTRTPGLAFKHRTADNPIGPGPNEAISPSCGWAAVANVTSSSALSGLFWWTVLAQFAIIDRDIIAYFGLDDNVTNTFYTLTHVLRSVGSFVVIDGKLAAILTRGNESPTFPVVGQAADGRNPSRSDYMRIAQLGGPWASDYGIATTRLAGARSANDTFAHEANALWIDFTLTTLPSSGNIEIEFRRTDSNNCWKLQVTSASTFSLVEVVAGTPTTRASITSNANGDRLLCVMEGAKTRLMRFRAGASTNSSVYASVSTFTTQTSGVISSLGTGGAISDLVTWPRVLSGDALAWVNAL